MMIGIFVINLPGVINSAIKGLEVMYTEYN